MHAVFGHKTLYCFEINPENLGKMNLLQNVHLYTQYLCHKIRYVSSPSSRCSSLFYRDRILLKLIIENQCEKRHKKIFSYSCPCMLKGDLKFRMRLNYGYFFSVRYMLKVSGYNRLLKCLQCVHELRLRNMSLYQGNRET